MAFSATRRNKPSEVDLQRLTRRCGIALVSVHIPSSDVQLRSTPFGGAPSIRPALESSSGETWTAEGTGGPLREKTTAEESAGMSCWRSAGAAVSYFTQVA